MGFFEPRNYERTLAELGQMLGADDRVTGMIPDTYGDPSRTSGYELRMPRSSELVRPFRDMGRGFVYAPRGDWHELLDADDRVTGMVGDPREKARRTEAEGLLRVENFARGLALHDDAESFIDRQTYLADGTVGSEERARGYKGEGARELLRGTIYGAANVPDAILGLAVDEDNILRMQPQAVKRVFAYEPTGDEEVDSALSAMHSLGEGIGETLATGAGAGLMKHGILTGAQYVPRQMMFRAPEVIKNTVPYSWQNKAHQMPHISEALKTPHGSNLLDAVTDGTVELAMVNQLVQEENGGTEDLATLGALAVGTGLLGNYASSLPRPTWKPVDTKRAPYEEAALRLEANRKAEMKKKDKEKGKSWKSLKQGGKEKKTYYDSLHDSVNKHIPHIMTNKGAVVHDEVFKNPIYHLPERYLDPKFEGYVNSIKDKNKREQERRKHLLPGSPIPHQIQYRTYKDGQLKLSEAEKEARRLEQEREIPVLDNEEIKVYADGELMDEQPLIGAQLSPNDGLIFKNELKRVFGKRAQLDKTDDNTFHITLPNGVELNAQTGDKIFAYGPSGDAVRGRYDLPQRTRFSLKGSLDHVNEFDLIRLSDLADADTLQHEAVHFAMNTVTTPKEKAMLREMFGEREEDQVAGVMDAIRQERILQDKHPMAFVDGLLRKIERFGGHIRSFTENVPTAIAKRDLSYLQGRSPRETLKDYAESFVDGSVWGREIAPVMKEFVQKHRDEIAETLKKQHSIVYPERLSITLAHRSPNIFSLLPYDNHPLRIDDSIVSKVLTEKHADSITPEHIAQLPQALEQPVMIIKGDWDVRGKTKQAIQKKKEERKDTYNFLLDMFDKNNANILVPIGFGYKKGKATVNSVKSIYGMSAGGHAASNRPDIKTIIQMVKHNDLVYVDKDKLLSLVRSYAPDEYYEVRDYLDHNLPEHVHTNESYREYRRRRGMKPELDLAENHFGLVNR